LITGTSIHEAIYDFAKGKSFDVIVMSTVGKGMLEHQLLGSTPSQVVRHVSTPILLVNPPHQAERKRAALQAN
jgi:nucleotide-binding universal stress UspA family protein